MAEKKKKAKGPIRFEAIIPITIVFVLFFVYFKFFFDNHLKMAIEYGGTYANGAEVNVGHLRTSFINASLDIHNIEVTNKEIPKENILQIGNIDFKATWAGLLRGKVIIPLASVKDIMIHTPRRHPGRVLPVKKSSENSMETLKGDALAATQHALDGSIFGDIAAVAQGTDYKDKLKEMEGNLKTSQFIHKTEAELKEKEKLWKERIEKLPKKEEFKAIEDRVKAIKVDGKNPASILAAIKEIDSLYKEVDSKVKAVNESKNSLTSDINQYKNLYSDIKGFVDQDMKDLEGKLGLPSLDPKDLAMRVFGRQFAGQIQRVEKYMRIAREYMPPPKAKDAPKKEELTPHQREVGKNYKFPKTGYYPKFWVAKAHINSKATDNGFSGTIGGEIIDITDDQKALGRPLQAKLSGDFPHSNIFGVLIHAIVDHTTDHPKETGKIKIGAFPLQDIKLSDSKDVTFGFKQATGASTLDVVLENDTVNLQFNAGFDKIDYLIEAEKAKVKEILTGISSRLGALTLHGSAGGTWKNLDLHLNSNIGERLQEALKQEFSKQVAELKQKLRDEVDKKIKGEKDKLLGQVKEFEQKFGVSLASKEEAIASLKKKLDEEKDKAKKQQGQKLEDAGKKLLKDLKFKF
ncbi:MAG: TIGR03545 family protein [Bdellovibrionaceae bacterium]|nr:TIGR03545 family protein [Pseudobdellovibrionaceae bacterium]